MLCVNSSNSTLFGVIQTISNANSTDAIAVHNDEMANNRLDEDIAAKIIVLFSNILELTKNVEKWF